MEDSPGRYETKSTSEERPRVLERIPSDEDGEEYTFVPRDADSEERLTRWITADSETLLDLIEWR